MKIPRYAKIVETDELYIVATLLKDCTVEKALQIVQNNRQMPSDKLLEVQIKEIDNKVCIIETFSK
ncbi:hypothetical protein [Granulicatella elegans]|uniref:hypothetical protein n=1 Tax=Granulicatella elegans TaxID=137732 RepID=UPI001D15C94E|nr:hypothetical protein [Granulicatella elegans]UEA30640.1 hypothetical protein LK443_04890 [Granulicatella elegans]